MNRSFVALLLLLLLCTSAKAATTLDPGSFAAFRFVAQQDCTTVMTDIDGNSCVYDGVLSPDSLEQSDAVARLAAYEVYVGETPVLSVQLHDVRPQDTELELLGVSDGVQSAPNGFYSVELPVGEDYTAFLTGLSADYLGRLQDTALDAIVHGDYLRLEDVSFIDAEKENGTFRYGELVDSDVDMCWAACMSNMLYYTGWATKAGFGKSVDEDDVFARLVSEFTDNGGSCAYGLQWFFNGFYPAQEMEGWAVDEKSYSSFSGYLPNYCVRSLVQECDLSASPGNMERVLSGLRAGCGVELGIDWTYQWMRESGHSLTLWGMVWRKGADLQEKESWHALIVSDSDDDMVPGEAEVHDRRNAPNALCLYRLTPACEGAYDSWYLDYYHTETEGGITHNAFLNAATLLTPYSSALKTDAGYRNTVKYPDLSVDRIDCYDPTERTDTVSFAADGTVCVQLSVSNASKKDCSSPALYRLCVTGQDGKQVRGESGYLLPYELSAGSAASRSVELGALDPGVYEVTVSLSTTAADAYLANNTLTKTIYVSERRRTEDDLSFAVSAVYDGAPRKDDTDATALGNESYGHLELTYSGALGYDVAQYVVRAEYDDGVARTVYCGRERPERIYGLRPVGEKVRVTVYLLPEDPLKGYACFIGSAEAELQYVRLMMDANWKNFSTIGNADTGFADGEALSLFFWCYDGNQKDPAFRLQVLARNRETGRDTLLYDEEIAMSEFDSASRLCREIRQFDVDPCGETQMLRSLNAGDYELWAFVRYDAEGSTYQYGDYYELGWLSVQFDSPQISEVYVLPVEADTTEIHYDLEAPSQTDFSFEVRYGTSEEALEQTQSVRYADYDGGTSNGMLTLDTKAGTTYYYLTVLRVGDREMNVTGIDSFTTPKNSLVIAQPDLVDFAPLEPGETAVAAKAGEAQYFETFLPDADGSWTVTLSGADGVVSFWDADQDCWGEQISLTPDGTTLTCPVRKDRALRLCVITETALAYRLRYVPDAAAYREEEDALALFIPIGEQERCLCARYAADDRLLSVQSIDSTGIQTIAGESGEHLCVFWLGGEDCVPTAAHFAYRFE
ncbi:MAG: hypothetical protein K6G54_01550 [Oscillospiraceae bacterium]|nr:hypothetical protein [Oscillospiraceae bacterium]